MNVAGTADVLRQLQLEMKLTTKASMALDELRSLLVVLRSIARHASLKVPGVRTQ
jgi:hypothetical protein